MKPSHLIEEKLNTITHALGFILSLPGLVLLIVFHENPTFWSWVSILLYGFSLTTLYLVSAYYHYVEEEKKKFLFRKLDHISIYLLIAGTYSPVVLITLAHSNGWLLFWIVWGIAAIGTILKVFYTGRFEVLSLLLYLVMGWLIIFDFTALEQVVPSEAIHLLIAGGIAYTTGIIFYLMRRLKYHHAIWHLFVLCGSIFHYLFIFLYII